MPEWHLCPFYKTSKAGKLHPARYQAPFLELPATACRILPGAVLP